MQRNKQIEKEIKRVCRRRGRGEQITNVIIWMIWMICIATIFGFLLQIAADKEDYKYNINNSKLDYNNIHGTYGYNKLVMQDIKYSLEPVKQVTKVDKINRETNLMHILGLSPMGLPFILSMLVEGRNEK